LSTACAEEELSSRIPAKTMDRRRSKRIKRRIPCQVVVDGEAHQGIVLDLSLHDMFVQTSATLSRSEQVEVVFPPDGPRPRIALRARVARRKQVPPRLVTITHPGLGLQILEAPPNYERMVKREPFLPQFRVMVRQRGSPRSRILTIESGNEEEARESALSKTGTTWEVLEVEPA
jgi:hypothetical protein